MIRPYYDDNSVTLYTGDAVEVLRELPDGCADCVVTSPPYWGLRDYGTGTGTWTGGDPSCHHFTGRGTSWPWSESRHRLPIASPDRTQPPVREVHRGRC